MHDLAVPGLQVRGVFSKGATDPSVYVCIYVLLKLKITLKHCVLFIHLQGSKHR